MTGIESELNYLLLPDLVSIIESYMLPKTELNIIRCNGNKCRMHWSDLYGMHCESCYGDSGIESSYVEYDPWLQIKIINCSGEERCGRSIYDSIGTVHCTACSGDID
jgi:hypothetical protein